MRNLLVDRSDDLIKWCICSNGGRLATNASRSREDGGGGRRGERERAGPLCAVTGTTAGDADVDVSFVKSVE